jgi:hypothetical protein
MQWVHDKEHANMTTFGEPENLREVIQLSWLYKRTTANWTWKST